MHMHHTRWTLRLWAVVLGLMLAMLAVGAAIAAYTDRAQVQSQRQLDMADKRLLLAMRWKSLAEVSVERVVIGALSSQDAVVQHMRDLSTAAIVQISETQQLMHEMASAPQELQALDVVAQARKSTLQWVDDVQAARSRGEMAFSLVLVQQQLRPAAERYARAQDALIALYERQRTEIRVQAEARRQRIWWGGVFSVGLLLAVSVVLTLGLTRSLALQHKALTAAP